jgi:hypothetical protein
MSGKGSDHVCGKYCVVEFWETPELIVGFVLALPIEIRETIFGLKFAVSSILVADQFSVYPGLAGLYVNDGFVPAGGRLS